MAAMGSEFVFLSQFKEYKEYMDNKLYPVNSLFLCADDTNPASVYGGVWERLEEGFLYSSPSDSTGTFTFSTDGLAASQTQRTAIRVAVWKRVS